MTMSYDDDNLYCLKSYKIYIKYKNIFSVKYKNIINLIKQ